MYDEAQLAQLNVESAAPEERPPQCSFLCGRAGTGKTTLIQTQVGRDPSYGMIGATTGIAAVNIGSTTINSLLGYFDTQSMRDEHMEGNLVRKLHKIAKDHQRLIIEEVSMMDGEQLDMLYRATCAANLYKAMPRLDLMVVGDFAQLPPVKAFWSLTLYDAKTKLLTANPINRYLINSAMLPNMVLGADGSLTIYIQKDSPGKTLESNWLPAPDGPIYTAAGGVLPGRTDFPSVRTV